MVKSVVESKHVRMILIGSNFVQGWGIEGTLKEDMVRYENFWSIPIKSFLKVC